MAAPSFLTPSLNYLESYTPIRSPLTAALMTSGPTISTPGLDPTETSIPTGAGLGLIGAIELYRYDSAHGITFRECELLDCSGIKIRLVGASAGPFIATHYVVFACPPSDSSSLTIDSYLYHPFRAIVFMQ
jgi:hypothetical protein